MSTSRILVGDARKTLKTIADNSIDSVATDPPYGLTSIVKRFGNNSASECAEGRDGAFKRLTRGFMGKEWDGSGIERDPEFWAEVLRVLKPGGHIVVFGGTRTHHRVWCAIEDAGFEIRDQLQWLYGSGFPKSKDVASSIDKIIGAAGNRGHAVATASRVHQTTGAELPSGDLLPAYEAVSDEAKEWQGWGTALKPANEIICLAAKPYPHNMELGIIVASLFRLESQLWSLLPASIAVSHFTLSPAEQKEAQDFAQWNAEELCNIQADLSEVMATSQFVPAMTSCLSIVQSWRRILDDLSQLMSMSTTEMAKSLTTDLKTLRFSLSTVTPRSIIQVAMQADGLPLNASLAGRIFSAVAMKSDSIRELSALDLAISQAHIPHPDAIVSELPANEPVCLARKPLGASSVGRNVLKYGTGALNIDACRIESNDRNSEDKSTATCSNGVHKYGLKNRVPETSEIGRWPANVIFDEEAAELLDQQTGTIESGQPCGLKSGGQLNVYGRFKGGVPVTGYGNSGGASRFFYCAKTDREERNVGCEAISEKSLNWSDGDLNPGSFQSEGTNRTARNNHPTVKPVALMSWLVTLITPPGGIVLDPFMGSGSTGIACHRLGFDFIGCEQSTEYVAIAEARLRGDDPLFSNVEIIK